MGLIATGRSFRRRAPFAAWTIAALIGCGGGGGGGGDGNDGPVPTDCIDVAGVWTVDEFASLDCDGFLDSFLPGSISGSGSIDLRQNGCALAYTVPGSGIERRGTIDGSYVRLSGPIAVVPGIEGVRVAANSLTIEGDAGAEGSTSLRLTGAGTLTVQFEGEESSCQVSSAAEFDR
jgi:hypothetical protein